MKKPDRSSYTPLDFLKWYEDGGLLISPKFQRRGVWSRAAQSYLIDTLLLGLPVPPIFLRVVQDKANKTVVREVIDGQQRISAVLGFLKDEYALSKNIESLCAGKLYSGLTDVQQDSIAHFSFICEVFYGVEDAEVLQVFARLNTHSVKLNSQELRNGKYFGKFKQSSYRMASQHLEFWRRNGLFTEQAIARMKEVELTSELMILIMNGIQDKKKSIDDFYEDYDESFKERGTVEARFRSVLDAINSSIGDQMPETEFRRSPLFYSLFGAVGHRLFGIPDVNLNTPKSGKLSKPDREGIREAALHLSEVIKSSRDEEEPIPAKYEAFVTACLRQTDNVRPRRTRLETIYRHSFA
jgi:hypothetical protein